MRMTLRRCWMFVAAAALTSGACSSPDRDSGPLVSFGALEDVLEGAVAPESWTAQLPADFLVGDAAAAALLVEQRAILADSSPETHRFTVVDVSRLAVLDRTACQDALLEPALAEGGPILLDATGATAAALRMGRSGAHLVRVSGAGRIASAADLAGGSR